MKKYNYKSYDDYVEAQTEANKRKLDKVWVDEDTILKVVKRNPQAKNILCHGTRNGAEQKYFSQLLRDAYVIGTEISETAIRFPKTIHWDFHNRKEEWVGKFDVVYTNAFDHSMYPEKALLTWIEQLNETGRLYIEFLHKVSDKYERMLGSRSDPFHVSEDELVALFEKCGLIVQKQFDTAGRHGKTKTKMYELVISSKG